jgi:rhamnopyranosyl-N-acetylglucosaminyl-diphospho-decaprenol beta-1,3/1,4-galactofuranosyltransferase
VCGCQGKSLAQARGEYGVKVLAVVVTHNRMALLSRCIAHLQAQTRPPNELLVINNASTDGTPEMLADMGVRFITQPNLGSAGGWHRGIEYALQQGYDAVWLMDDDGYPDASALGVLTDALGPDVVCASSVVVREDAPESFVFPFPVLAANGLPVLFGRQRKIPTRVGLARVAPSGSYSFAHFFNGALIQTSAIRQVGNVDAGFFMFGDEVDYFFRLRAVGRVLSVLDALHYHPDVSQRPYTKAKIYYYLKNTLILNKRYFDQVWARHMAAIAAVLVRTAKRNGLAAALSCLAGRSAPFFYTAIARGLEGRVGKDLS